MSFPTLKMDLPHMPWIKLATPNMKVLSMALQSLNSQWARNVSPEDVLKDDRHVLILAAVLHVLFDQPTKFLHGDEKCPPPQIISSTTLLRSIALCQYFTEQRGILDQISGKVPIR